MSLDMNSGPSRSSSQELWPKWMWIAVPVLVVVVVAGLWWAILSPPEPGAPTPTATPTARLITTQPTQAPTMIATLALAPVTPTLQVLPTLATFTPVPAEVAATPTGEPTAAPATTLAIGGKAVANAGAGLNMRSGAGTGQSVVKRLPKDTEVEIIGGPKEANDYTWWQVRDSAGVTGWVASEFLNPK
jgi:uncharacterized protein YgiM (DUF1202 family)